MRRATLLLLPALYAPSAFAAACSGVTPNYAATDGGFGVLGGKLYAPDGQAFVAHGVDVMEGNQPSAAQLQATMPGVNFVRLAIYANNGVYPTAASLAPYVDSLTAAGIVVELEDHTTSTGSNAGGGQGDIFTGSLLANEQAFYSSAANLFQTDPYVWFGTDNEPSDTNPATGQGDMAALGDWQQQTINTIRATGDAAPIMVDPYGGGAPYMPDDGIALSSAQAAGDTNLVYDLHFYGSATTTSTNQSTLTADLTSDVTAAQQRQSADGTVPVILGEYGDSTDGVNIDPNAAQAINAVQTSTVIAGSVAWGWMQGASGDSLLTASGSLSAFGQQVAAYIATGGATGCPASPVPTTQDIINATAAVDGATLTTDASGDLALPGSSNSSAAQTTLPNPTSPPVPVSASVSVGIPPQILTAPITAPALAPSSTTETAPPLVQPASAVTAPALASNSLSIAQVAALAAAGP